MIYLGNADLGCKKLEQTDGNRRFKEGMIGAVLDLSLKPGLKFPSALYEAL